SRGDSAPAASPSRPSRVTTPPAARTVCPSRTISGGPPSSGVTSLPSCARSWISSVAIGSAGPAADEGTGLGGPAAEAVGGPRRDAVASGLRVAGADRHAQAVLARVADEPPVELHGDRDARDRRDDVPLELVRDAVGRR